MIHIARLLAVSAAAMALLLMPAAAAEQADFAIDPDLPHAEWVLREAPVRTPGQSIATFDLPDGFRVEPVASEPLVRDPIDLAFGPDGRLWVVELPSYNWPYREAVGLEPGETPGDRIVVLEDTSGDGEFDTRTVFKDGLQGPRTVSLVADGVLVAMPPEVWFYRDTTGDGKADDAQLVLDDYGPRANPHIMPNGLLWAMDNWIYSAYYGKRLRRAGGAWETDGPIVSRGQWGITQDNVGRLYYNHQADPLRGDRVRPAYWRRNPNLPEPAGINVRLAHDFSVYTGGPTPGVQPVHLEDGVLFRFTSSGSPVIYRGEQFPPEVVGDAFVNVPTANFIRHWVLDDAEPPEASNAYEDHEFLFSHDERFRPVHAATGPEGALWVVDMYRGIIEGHPWIEDSMRDYMLARGLHEPFNGLGRIYRIVHEGRPTGEWPNLAEADPHTLVEQLSHHNGWRRDTAQRLLVEGAAAEVAEDLRQLVTAGDNQLARLHALWTLEGVGLLDAELLRQAVGDAFAPVREAAIHLAERWLDDASVREAVLAMADDAEAPAGVQRQLLFTLGEFEQDASEAVAAMHRILHRSGGEPWMAEAAVSGLHGRELEFLRDLRNTPAWQDAPAGGQAVVARLAEAITNAGEPERLEQVAEWIATGGAGGWWASPMLAGVEQGRSANLAAAPAAARRLLELEDPALATRATAMIARAEGAGAAGAYDVDVAALEESVRALYERGREGYLLCAACHQADGEGLAAVAPALAGSDWLEAEDSTALLGIVLNGYDEDEAYSPMPPVAGLEDEQIAAILTYLRLTLGGANAGAVTPADVRGARERLAGREGPWSAEGLEALGAGD